MGFIRPKTGHVYMSNSHTVFDGGMEWDEGQFFFVVLQHVFNLRISMSNPRCPFKGPIFIWLEEAWEKISHILNLRSSTPRTLSQFLMMSHKQMDVFSCSHVLTK